MTVEYRISAGHPEPMGPTLSGDGANFAVFSEHATRIEICLFGPEGGGELVRLPLPERTGHVWHGHVAGIKPGQHYGLRAHGPFAPEAGHRFNPNKLLIDPYARRLTGHPRWSDALLGYDRTARERDLSFSDIDSAPDMPRCVIEAAGGFEWQGDVQPRTPMNRTVIYEAHVKGLTMRMPGAAHPGSFLGLASDAALAHMTRLGVTAVELLPVHAFLDDAFLTRRGLRNYWGYQSINFFAPDPRYLVEDDIAEFQRMVARLHGAGIEVILDVVYNHSGEGNEFGPTLSFRGLDNASYYRLAGGGRHYVNDTGCGNTLNMAHPRVLQMVLDSLRYWVEMMHVDGFRFDLATTLARRAEGFTTDSPFLAAIRQDPVLRRVKLIAEPWDVGPGGYQLGAFGHPFGEWNDKFRDDVRRFWRGDYDIAAKLAERITGSARQFDHSGRAATASINMITAHDGFTLADLVSYSRKHNAANGERNRDGHDANYSDNMGHEGPTKDADTSAARTRRRRNLMATLLLSQGTPMILAGDEIGNSQRGNNNAYCQDNEIGWLDWDAADQEFCDFTSRLIAFRQSHPILRQKLFLHSRERALDGMADLFWWHPEGRHMTSEDWHHPERATVCAELRTAPGTPEYDALETALFVVFNGGAAQDVHLPPAPEGCQWCCHIDTAAPSAPPRRPENGWVAVQADTVVALVLECAE